MDDFNIDFEKLNVEREKTVFKLEQLKLEHYYFEFDKDEDKIIKTSIELFQDYNYEKNIKEWKLIIKDIYNNEEKEETKEIDNNIIEKLQQNDLRELKNNYYTEIEPENYTHWELTYNNKFKIVGTYDQEIEEIENIKSILDFKNIIKK